MLRGRYFLDFLAPRGIGKMSSSPGIQKPPEAGAETMLGAAGAGAALDVQAALGAAGTSARAWARVGIGTSSTGIDKGAGAGAGAGVARAAARAALRSSGPSLIRWLAESSRRTGGASGE